jgi:hypothetical protein
MARRAGTKQAYRATASNSRVAVTNVSGSVALTPSNKFAISRLMANVLRPAREGRPTSITRNTLSEHQLQHLRAIRAESHADPDFPGSLAGCERHHAVHAYDRQRQSHRSDRGGEQGPEAEDHEAVRAGERVRHAAEQEDRQPRGRDLLISRSTGSISASGTVEVRRWRIRIDVKFCASGR